MAESGAHLVDHVLPWVPVRQWALTVPWRLRFLMARDPALCSAVRRSFLRAVQASYRARAESEGVSGGRTGAVCVVQRFSSALNLNVHFHALVLDGVYTTSSPLARPRFHAASELANEEVERLVVAVRERTLRLLRRRGLLAEESPDASPVEAEPEGLFAELAAASIQGRVALGASRGRATARLAFVTSTPEARPDGDPAQCAQLEGFSLHARVRVDANDRERLERLCRYVTRPPIATERLSVREDGLVVYGLRRPWRDGTTHVVFEPLDLLSRLAALVPPRRAHVLTYHGVLAPAAEWRDEIVPRERGNGHDVGSSGCASASAAPASSRSGAAGAVERSPGARYRWSELMRRVFAVDVLRCDRCGGRRELIALIRDPATVRRILTHLGLEAQPPPRAPARDPPQGAFAF